MDFIRNLHQIIHEKDRIIQLQRRQIENFKRQIIKFNARNFFFQLSEDSQKRVISKVRKQIQILNTNIEGYAIMIDELKISRYDRENENKKKTRINVYDELGEIKMDLDVALYLKDKYLISDLKYSVIRNEFKADIPSLKRIRKKKKELNAAFIYTTTNLRKSIGIGEIEESYGSLIEPMNYIMSQIKDFNILNYKQTN